MSERKDQKLREVVVGEYRYRHEAEFAAGFLDEADIPYRLQIDDPGMGLTVGSPALIWVRSMDLDRANEILDVGNQIVVPKANPPVPRPSVDGGLASTRLTPRERMLSAVGAGGFVWLGWYLLQSVGSGTSVRLSGIAAFLLAAAAIAGRAPRVLKGILAALSGSAP